MKKSGIKQPSGLDAVTKAQKIILRYAKQFFIEVKAGKKNRRLVNKLAKGNLPIKLELGETKTREGMRDWIKVDLGHGADLRLDLSKPLPIPDDFADIIYSSHLLEHFSYPHPLLDLLKECRRILKPGGIFSACVPNARIYTEAYLNKKAPVSGNFLKNNSESFFNSPIDYLNRIAYMHGEHKYMFDEENLPIILEKSGFRNVKLRKFDPNLDRKERLFESIYVQGVK